jgi:hypothetical protein
MFPDLFLKFLTEFDAENLEKLFYEHFKYGTADVYIENDEILAAVRWNIGKSGFTANILDLFIKEGCPSVKVMRWFGKRGHERFPKVKYIKFLRGKKFPEDKARIYKVSSLIKD